MSFKPTQPAQASTKAIHFHVSPEEHAAIKAGADKSRLSMQRFIVQAVRYALDNMDNSK